MQNEYFTVILNAETGISEGIITPNATLQFFFKDDRRTARETLRFAAGQCVSYQETLVAGDKEMGAYVSQLISISAGLSLAPGGAL